MMDGIPHNNAQTQVLYCMKKNFGHLGLWCLVIVALLATAPMVLGCLLMNSSTQADYGRIDRGNSTLTLNMRSGCSHIGMLQIGAPVIAWGNHPEARN